MNFEDFMAALNDVRSTYGDNTEYVMHFRISTQGGINPECCHPFPLSPYMEKLRRTEFRTPIGIAHNGIIRLTSSGWQKTITYSDTMAFIVEYLCLIIQKIGWWKDEKTVRLIAKLADSKLAILGSDGHCELIGRGWIEDNGIWYSNDSFREPCHPKAHRTGTVWVDADDWYGDLLLNDARYTYGGSYGNSSKKNGK